MECYFDNSATTRPLDAVVEKMEEAFRKNYGNPSSLHMKGVEAEEYLKETRKIIAKTLKCQEKEIYFTSGGTESNNLAIIGSAMANHRSGKHIITTPIEHAAVSNPVKFLEEQGYQVDYLSVDSNGLIDLDQLSNLVREDTILVSIMYVNNEIGALEPIEEAAKVIKAKNPNCLFHVDAVQSYGKYEMAPSRWGVDLLAVSGHKIHGPKGSGFLYIKDKTKIKPIILGGGQEKGMRSGTENVPAIAGLGVAAEEMYKNLPAYHAKTYELKQALIQGLSQIEGITINGLTGEADSAAHIVSVSVKGVRAEVLLHALEDKEIYVSAGSACSSNKPAVSATLKAIKIDPTLLDSTVRFSFCPFNTLDQVEYAVNEMKTIVPMLQKYMRR